MYARRYSNRVDLQSSKLRPEVDKTKDLEFWRRWDEASERAAKNIRLLQVKDWPRSLKLAILMIARTKDALTCIAALSGSNTRPGQNDFLFLRQYGYATKNLGDRYHRLTSDGWKVADKATFALAGELGLHIRDVSFDRWSEHTLRCSCGFTAHVNRRANSSTVGRLMRSWNEHLAAPNDWKIRDAKVKAIIESVEQTTTDAFKGDAS